MYRRPEFFLLLCPHAGGDIRIPGKQDFFSKKILPRPENLIYFSAHGRRKAPIVPSGCSSGVERNLAKVDVVGSNPIIRSNFL